MPLLRELVDALPRGAVAVTDGGRCHCNERAKLILGRSVSSLDELGEILLSEGGSETAADLVSRITEGTLRGETVEVSIRVPGSPDERRVVTLQATEVGAVGGGTLILIASESTDAQALAQVERMEQLAAVGQLTAGVTHEINNILTAILGWTQIALRRPEYVEKVESALGIIDENCRRAKSIIDDVMGFARPSAKHEEPVQISEVADEVLRVLSFELHNGDITVDRSYREVHPVLANRRRLFQVFLNLVLNAVQAMPQGGSLRISTDADSRFTWIEFRDSGHGIAKDALPKIFDSDFTTKPSGETGGGTGLGLSISRKLITKLGGEITVESRLGQGSAFTVKLPSAQSIRVTRRAESAELELPSGLKVLVVDDEPHIREMIREALEGSGAEVVIARNGVEAIELNRRLPIDLAIVDFSMPGVSGQTLIERLKRRTPGLAVVVLSGRLGPTDLGSAGADEVLRKPFDLSELQRCLLRAAAALTSRNRSQLPNT